MPLEQHRELIKECKVRQFGAFLQSMYFFYEDEQPNPPDYDLIYSKMRCQWEEFEIVYNLLLKAELNHPLALEQEAWTLLSPLIKKHIDEKLEFFDSSSPEFLAFGYQLIQRWSIISDSFKAKYETCLFGKNETSQTWILETEQALQQLIDQLRSEQSANKLPTDQQT